MASHDRFEMDVLKQLTRIVNSLDKIEKKLPKDSKIKFEENILGGLHVGYEKDEYLYIWEPMKEDWYLWLLCEF